jgi:hypothetical protein
MESAAAAIEVQSLTAMLAELRLRTEALAAVVQRQSEIATSFLSPFTNTDQASDLLISKILASGYFSPAYYRSQIDAVTMSDRELSLDYLRRGERGGHAPSTAFSPAYYAQTNPDVVVSDFGLLEHFVLLGRAEGCPWRRRELQTSRKLRACLLGSQVWILNRLTRINQLVVNPRRIVVQ